MYKTFSSREVLNLSGVTQRQIQWWDERKVVCPHLRGHTREFSPEHTVAVMLVAELRRKGVSLQKVRLLSQYVQKRLPELFRAPDLDKLCLLTDGKRTYIESDFKKIVDCFRESKQGMWLVALGQFIETVKAAIPPEYDGSSRGEPRYTDRMSKTHRVKLAMQRRRAQA